MVLPYLLSVEMAVLYMMKFGFEPPVTKQMSGLAQVKCTLEDAFIKIIGVTPSAQPAIGKKSTAAIGRARMLQELYKVAQAFRSRYSTAFRETLLKIKPEAMHKLAIIHRDPVTLTVRPSLGDKDPYSTMTGAKYNKVIESMVNQRAPRFVHECCKLMNDSRDVPHSSIFSLPAIKDWKIVTEQRMSNQCQALAQELHPGQYLAQYPFRQADIPLYRQRLFTGKFEVIPIVDYELNPGLTTITRNSNAPTAMTNEVSVSLPPPYLALTP